MHHNKLLNKLNKLNTNRYSRCAVHGNVGADGGSEDAEERCHHAIHGTYRIPYTARQSLDGTTGCKNLLFDEEDAKDAADNDADYNW